MSSSGDVIHGLPAIGSVIDGKLEIVGVLGTGGMGTVLEARHRHTGRAVAVKMLRPDLARDADAVQRLLQEALACGRIQHPNVVDVYDAGVHEGAPYVVMELLRGESAATRLDRTGALSIDEAIQITLGAAHGVAAAHAQGIVHRDLKPDNLFIAVPPGRGGSEIVKVVDFGISKLSASSAPLAQTQTGLVLGTPHYMSPEQARGAKQIDARTDIYSLGASLFHLSTGRVPYDGDNYNSLMMSIVHDELPDPRSARPDMPESVAVVIARAMAKSRDERFATASELVAALEALEPQVAGAPAPAVVRRSRDAIALAETGIAPTPFTSPNLPRHTMGEQRRRWPAALAVAGLVAALGVVLTAWITSSDEREPRIDRALVGAPTRPASDVRSLAPTIAPTPRAAPIADPSAAHDAATAAAADGGIVVPSPSRRAPARPRPVRRDPDRGVL